MSDSANFALHRPEFLLEIERGKQKIAELLRGRSRSYESGAVIVDADTEHSYVYRLRSGWVCRTRQLEDGRTQFILIFLPGDLFAVKSLFMARHTDEIEALSEVVAERIDCRELHAAYVRDSDVASRCMWQVMEEERRLHNWVVGLGQGAADERLAALMLDLRARLSMSGAIPKDALAFQLPLTQGQLGDFLGLTAVHVNRVLRGLREAGVLMIRDGVVTIESLSALVKLGYPLLDTYERSTPAYVGHHGASRGD